MALPAANENQSPLLDIEILEALERKVLWLATQMIHHANHVRPGDDGLKVGGHQASSASLATVMTALYLRVLRPHDRVAVKPHAAPVFHAIQYLLGHQSLEALQNFRGFGGAQSYPSRTKDHDDVDFSTGSVGLGAAVTAFASLARDYLSAQGRDLIGADGRMVALIGDAELDEGNIFECLLEGWKHELRNLWWVIDYNRQSLDSVVSDQLFQKHADVFDNMGWQVVTIKYGRRLQAAFEQDGGAALRTWIDTCPNALYSALTFQGGAAWRNQLTADLASEPRSLALISDYSDDDLHDLMTNLGGHDMACLIEAFETAPADRPVCFIAYTVKGRGLPIQGHKDNHAGLMTPQQMDQFRRDCGIEPGAEWDRSAGLPFSESDLSAKLSAVPFAQTYPRRYDARAVPVDGYEWPEIRGDMSTQEGFGKILAAIGASQSQLADHIVTTSPDVAVSTNLGPWINRRALFARTERRDVFKDRQLMSPQRWEARPNGQHIELGIAENNLFLCLAALGLSHSLFGERILPIGTLYDPFIARGLDALNYACYQDARFILVATPSGITLAPEGGAHQSVGTPLIGLAQDGLASFEPTYVDELAVILDWAFSYIQRHGEEEGDDGGWLRDDKGGSVYLRLSTRAIAQPIRTFDDRMRRDIILGGYWMRPPAEGADLAIVYTGILGPDAATAMGRILDRCPGAGLLAVTSSDRLNAGWHAAQRARRAGMPGEPAHIESLLAPLSREAQLVTVLDGHPATLSWLGGVGGHCVQALGVEHFGQTGTITDLYRHHHIDADSIADAVLNILPKGRRLGMIR